MVVIMDVKATAWGKARQGKVYLCSTFHTQGPFNGLFYSQQRRHFLASSCSKSKLWRAKSASLDKLTTFQRMGKNDTALEKPDSLSKCSRFLNPLLNLTAFPRWFCFSWYNAASSTFKEKEKYSPLGNEGHGREAVGDWRALWALKLALTVRREDSDAYDWLAE